MKAFRAIFVVLSLIPAATAYAEGPKLVIGTDAKDLDQLKCIAELSHKVSDLYKSSPKMFNLYFGGVSGQVSEIRLIGHLRAGDTMVNEAEYRTPDGKVGAEFVTDFMGGCSNFAPIQQRMDKATQVQKDKEQKEKDLAAVTEDLKSVQADFNGPDDAKVATDKGKVLAAAKSDPSAPIKAADPAR